MLRGYSGVAVQRVAQLDVGRGPPLGRGTGGDHQLVGRREVRRELAALADNPLDGLVNERLRLLGGRRRRLGECGGHLFVTASLTSSRTDSW